MPILIIATAKTVNVSGSNNLLHRVAKSRDWRAM